MTAAPARGVPQAFRAGYRGSTGPLLLGRTTSSTLRLVAAAALWTSTPAAVCQQVNFVEVASGFEFTTDIQHAPGDDTLFLVEQDGQIHVVEDGGPRPTPLLDIRDRVAMTGELGLLGLAFDPHWPGQPYLYVHYTRTQSGGAAPFQTVIARYQADPTSLTASPGSELILLTSDQPSTAHNAGALAFDSDLNLLVSLGDGGESHHAQETTSLLGKILRLNVRGTGLPLDCGQGAATVTPGNPFVNGAGGACDEVYAMGLRNPWRLSIDPVTSDLWVGDVGDGSREEVNLVQSGGGNYGWPIMEGSMCVEVGCDTSGLTLPVYEYGQNGGQAITGGYLYRRSGDLFGRYVFGDFVSGDVWALDGSTATPIASLPGTLTTFGVDHSGHLYAALWVGSVYRMEVPGTQSEGGPASPGHLVLDGPNPFSGHTTIVVTPAESGRATVTLRDVLGRQVATLFEGAVEAGVARALPIDAKALAPGSYVVILSSSRGTASLRLAIRR